MNGGGQCVVLVVQVRVWLFGFVWVLEVEQLYSQRRNLVLSRRALMMSTSRWLLPLGLACVLLTDGLPIRRGARRFLAGLVEGVFAGVAARIWLLPMVVDCRVLPLVAGSGPYVRLTRPRYVGWRDDAVLTRWVESHLADAEYAVGAEALRLARAMKAKRDGTREYHITLCGSWEFTSSGDELLDRFCAEAARILCLDDATPIGMGRLEEVGVAATCNFALYVVVEWAALQELRRRYGLPPNHPHITVGFRVADIHSRPKGCESLLGRPTVS